MYQKLRSDLANKLARVRLILVNADGFVHGVNGSDANSLNGHHIKELREYDVEFIAFSEKKSQALSSVAEEMGIVLYEGISEKSEFLSKMKSEYSVSDDEVACICLDESDLPIIGGVAFSAVMPAAPLSVKGESYFPTYCVGSEAVSEIAELVLKAKKYPGGWSE